MSNPYPEHKGYDTVKYYDYVNVEQWRWRSIGDPKNKLQALDPGIDPVKFVFHLLKERNPGFDDEGNYGYFNNFPTHGVKTVNIYPPSHGGKVFNTDKPQPNIDGQCVIDGKDTVVKIYSHADSYRKGLNLRGTSITALWEDDGLIVPDEEEGNHADFLNLLFSL